jgi:hypothetical protein
MSNALAVKVEPILEGFTGKELEAQHWNDWTPVERRVLARRLEVKTGFGHVAIIEIDKANPSLVNLYAHFDARRGGRQRDEEIVLDSLSAQELDQLIEALTTARDHAIANWMIEPA